MAVVRRVPLPVLRDCVDGRLEGWTGTAATLREVPFPGLPLIFNLGEPWTIVDGRGAAQRLDSFVAGLHTGPTVVEGPPAFACIELRLSALGARRLLGLPMHELADRTVAVEDVLPGAAELGERLRDTASWETRFDLLESFLAARVVAAEAPSPEVEQLWQRLLRSGGRAAIGTLATEVGWSPRRLIARFREHVGLAPKAAARVIRFDRAAAALRAGDPRTLAELALDCGYFDQAHLSRDFRELAGASPAAFAGAVLDSGGIAA